MIVTSNILVYFSDDHFSNIIVPVIPEGTKYALCHKFRRLTICSTMYTCQTRVAIETHFQTNALHSSIDLLSRPPSLKQSQRQGLFFVMPVDSLVVDSMFEESKNVQ